MEEDVKKLSELGIKSSDLEYNILFDGENLVAIDTLLYCKVKNKYLYPVVEKYNFYAFRKGFENQFNSIDQIRNKKFQLEKMGIDAYLESIEKTLRYN